MVSVSLRRRDPLRVTATRTAVAVAAAFLAACLTAVLVAVPVAGAQEPLPPAGTDADVVGSDMSEPSVLGETEVARDIPVTLGRPGAVFPDRGWFESGPVVPLMAFGTVAMLAVGGAMIAGRCRRAQVA